MEKQKNYKGTELCRKNHINQKKLNKILFAGNQFISLKENDLQ